MPCVHGGIVYRLYSYPRACFPDRDRAGGNDHLRLRPLAARQGVGPGATPGAGMAPARATGGPGAGTSVGWAELLATLAGDVVSIRLYYM